MKKLALCLMTFILCVCSVGATEFVPSVTNGGAPDVVTTNVNGEEIVGYVVDENGNQLATVYPGCIYTYSLEDALDQDSKMSDATRKMIVDLYNEFKDGKIKLSEVLPALNDLVAAEFGEQNNADNMILRDLFLCDLSHAECKDWLAKDGTTIDLTFKTDIEKGTFLQVAYYKDGQWHLADKVVNNNDDDNPENDGTVTVTFEDLCPVVFLVPGEMNEAAFNWWYIIIAIIIAIAGYVYSKKSKK